MSAKSKGSLVSKCMGGVELGPVITLTEDTIEERPLPQENTSNKQKHDTVDEPIVMITCSVSAVFELHTSDNKKT